MIDVALLGIIRRWYIRDRISIREIARRLDISRNTVRRYIRSDVSEPAYPARRSPSSLDEFTARLSAWLSAEAIKSRKQRRTLKQMFLDLRELGYEGSYDRVAAFSRQWKVGQMERVKSASKSTRYIEVKSVGKLPGEEGYRFFLSDNEHTVSELNSHRSAYFFYLVFFGRDGNPETLREICAEELYQNSELSPASYVVRFAFGRPERQ
ncbi:winged helix-turn-helix transcriptional regulator [Herbaspirillum seropedicae]|nr:winged helix-turn-helix transcriptional regulator [Herbaspirillum sp. alder98]